MRKIANKGHLFLENHDRIYLSITVLITGATDGDRRKVGEWILVHTVPCSTLLRPSITSSPQDISDPKALLWLNDGATGYRIYCSSQRVPASDSLGTIIISRGSGFIGRRELKVQSLPPVSPSLCLSHGCHPA